MKIKMKSIVSLFISICCFFLINHSLYAQQTIDLTFEKAIDIALDSSFQIQQLELGIERTRYLLKAREAGLKSSVYMNLRSPDLKVISESEWNSTLQMDEIVRQNTQRWQIDLSIRQPVIILGYPTNGYLSLNNTMYKYLQKKDSTKYTNFYNRYFIRFEQPLFQPNYLKNSFEEAKLDLQRSELQYFSNQSRLISRTANTYYNLFDLSYKNLIYSRHVENLEKVYAIVNDTTQEDPDSSIDSIQVRVALANIQEDHLRNQSDFRFQSASMKQRLRLNYNDSLYVRPEITINPIIVEPTRAIEYGYTLSPTIQFNEIDKRRNEINLEETKGRNSFRINLEMTYGLEKQDEMYQELWYEHDTSYSISIRAYFPIWDWGQRKSYIEASKINIRRTELNMEENRNEIRSEITNAITSLKEYQLRAVNMKNNMDMALEMSSISILQFEEGRISVKDILNILEKQQETELNFLDAYMGYRGSLLRLMINTYYDYENEISLIDRFNTG